MKYRCLKKYKGSVVVTGDRTFDFTQNEYVNESTAKQSPNIFECIPNPKRSKRKGVQATDVDGSDSTIGEVDSMGE